MSIAMDMIGPLVVLAQAHAALAQTPETAAIAARVQSAIDVIEELRDRVAAMEASACPTIPPRRQHRTLSDLATGAVISLREARAARMQKEAAR
jgi:HAMP domain-containing protein